MHCLLFLCLLLLLPASARIQRWTATRRCIQSQLSASSSSPSPPSSSSSSSSSLLPTKLSSAYPPRNDSIVELMAIFSITSLLATICPQPIEALKRVGPSYDNFVQVSKLLLRGRSPNGIRDSITGLLTKVLPKFVRNFFRDQYAKSPKLICELSVQWFGFGFLTWLIGPVEPALTEIVSKSDGSVEVWNSTVKLLECRYLMESGCKAACTQLCKRPTQAFFNEQLNVPLYMKPNFTNYSCEMMFGVEPPDDADDPAYTTVCYSQCALNNNIPDTTCSKLPSFEEVTL